MRAAAVLPPGKGGIHPLLPRTVWVCGSQDLGANAWDWPRFASDGTAYSPDLLSRLVHIARRNSNLHGTECA
jgi:hypothetical protein